MKKLPFLLIPIILITAVYIKTTKTTVKHPEGAYLFSGTAETTSINLSFKIPGVISKINFDEGDTVNAGDIIAELDSTDEKLAVSAAQANLKYNESILNEVLAGSRKQEVRNAKAAVDMAKASVNKAKAELDQAASDKERFTALYSENGISKRTFELYMTAYEKAQQSFEEAKASETKAKENLSLAMEGARSEAIEKAKALVYISEQSILQAEQKLAYTQLSSPISGTVLTKSAENGEFTSTGAVILSIADLNDMWIRTYVSEPYLGKIKLGQKAVVKSDSYPDKEFSGKVTYIASEAEFTPKTVQTYEERINYMYKVKITVENTDQAFKQGMPVNGRIIFSN